jgi:hypothetical protein
LSPEQAQPRRSTPGRRGAADHNAAVMAVLFLVFGFKLVGDGVAVLF